MVLVMVVVVLVVVVVVMAAVEFSLLADSVCEREKACWAPSDSL